ncbi:MAG TPA: PP2C family protein-serine/threonine phosphatase [Pyrinomonadaceae bacterium]|nr:PP2C family protein-serine/threonine phosphatase [Pyrinomonadaceae bacterium]
MLLLLAATAYAALVLLVPRLNPAAQWGFTFDRDGAVTHARAEAARRGFDASQWHAHVSGYYQGQTVYYLSRRGEREETALLSPVNTRVQLLEPGGRRRLRVDLTTAGRVAGFAYRDPSPPAKEDVPIETTRRAAQAALSQLVGDAAAEFRQVSEVAQDADGVRFNWERSVPGDADIKLQVTSLVRGETVREIKLNEKFAPHFQDEYNNRRREVQLLDLFGFLSVVAAVLLVGAFFLLCLARGEINYWSALILLVALSLFCFLLRIFTGSLDGKLLDFESNNAMSSSVRYALGLLQVALIAFFSALGLAIVWSAGRSLARRSDPRQLASFAALLKGKVLTKPMALRVAVGVMLGGGIAAIPYLVAASGLFPTLVLQRPNPTALISRAPALAWLTVPISFTFFTLYGFLHPLFNNFIKRPRVVHALVLLIGFLWLLDEDLYETSIAGALVIGGLLILIADWIFRRYDLLTLCVASLAADVAVGAGALLAQPSSELQASGWRALAGLGVALAAALVVSKTGRDARIEEYLEPLPVSDNPEMQKAERERLVAEFGVARQAQQQMLPAAAPTIPGYSIAATCRPAREVGGDLYDFLTLPNERVGIVVADVSGKGVPAALYMTLTKGLLASVAEHESDPAAILREVNRHLYDVCGRKVFVTMILGVLDPPTRTFTYARAGHNPGVWRSSETQTQTLLRAAGLGLGLNKGRLFDQTLRHESIKVGRGDVVLFYSDGVTEAMNADGEEFGEARLLSAVSRTDGLTAAQTRDEILAEVGQFLGETPPQDDVTLVVVRVVEGF